MSKPKITDHSKSPYAELDSIPMNRVEIRDSLLRRKMEVNHSNSIPDQLSKCKDTGRIANFKIARGLEEEEISNHLAADSDIYKLLEAISYDLSTFDEGKLRDKMDEVIDLIEKAQEEDGYLNTSYTVGGGYLHQPYVSANDEYDKWKDLSFGHELYCGGHLIQSAIAHHRRTGEEKFLKIAKKWADHVSKTFGPNQKNGTGGHPEVEMSLVELYRETSEKKYLDLAEYLVNVRGTEKSGLNSGIQSSEYFQDHKPIYDQKELKGHAVRQLYLLSGLTDIYSETGDEDLWETLLSQWKDLKSRKMAVTGGCGSRYNGEAFGEPHELTNRTGYYETCAAIASFMWNWRMLQVTGEAKYADLMERTLYNGLLSGVSQDGRKYFYTNPLEHDGGRDLASQYRGSNRRTTKHFDGTACCPPNVARLLASIPGYIYGVSDNSLYVHHYVASSVDYKVGEKRVKVTQESRYPWEGKVKLKVDPETKSEFRLMVRIPSWAEDPKVKVNGENAEIEPTPNEYSEIRRKWSFGDEVDLEFPMRIKKIVANPRVSDNTGCIALMRGPVVYCIEGADYPKIDLYTVTLPKDADLKAEFDQNLLRGVVVIKGEGMSVPYRKNLYNDLRDSSPSKPERVDFTAIPYFAWANRDPGAMRVWIPLAEIMLNKIGGSEEMNKKKT
ncbi:hypothetical protein AKJ65_07175 [candidate division MSBL1 archaeon SCGC-AAA259E19]|uniref:Glycosyl hydrolase n=1 Tax=candidate division MSBL1 archaeon SCGC-AAA259E19 TaxID=1698264 RepID=A0A133UEV4_9EURY|nr:hypothetical protein AKJ65_07175 [candidate division MSBL1 archaeon SCGC-AAA259E19]